MSQRPFPGDPQRISSPDVAGLSVEAATAQLEDAGFEVVNGGFVDSAYARGTVAYSSPGAYSEFGSGDTVTIYISDGTPKPPPKPPKNNDNGGGGNDNGGRGNGNGGGHGNG